MLLPEAGDRNIFITSTGNTHRIGTSHALLVFGYESVSPS